jgi:acylphosphatase
LGWVKNLNDGGVEAVFEGESNKVKELIEWIKKGPLTAKVRHIDIKREDYKGEFKSFELRSTS